MSYREWYKEYLSIFNEAFIVEQIQKAGQLRGLSVEVRVLKNDKGISFKGLAALQSGLLSCPNEYVFFTYTFTVITL